MKKRGNESELHSFCKFYLAHRLYMMGHDIEIEYSFARGEKRFDVWDRTDGIVYEIQRNADVECKEVYRKYVQVKDVIVIVPSSEWLENIEIIDKKLGV